MIGKPDSGKPTVRFDKGELEIEPKVTTPVLYSTDRGRKLISLSGRNIVSEI
jgi:hypothetical protein